MYYIQFLELEKVVHKLAPFYDENTIFYGNHIKYGFDKYVEDRVKKIYTNTTFVKDKTAFIKVRQIGGLYKNKEIIFERYHGEPNIILGQY